MSRDIVWMHLYYIEPTIQNQLNRLETFPLCYPSIRISATFRSVSSSLTFPGKITYGISLISGSSPAQIVENLKAAEFSLTEEQLNSVSSSLTFPGKITYGISGNLLSRPVFQTSIPV